MFLKTIFCLLLNIPTPGEKKLVDGNKKMAEVDLGRIVAAQAPVYYFRDGVTVYEVKVSRRRP
jgi:hypothetical protein